MPRNSKTEGGEGGGQADASRVFPLHTTDSKHGATPIGSKVDLMSMSKQRPLMENSLCVSATEGCFYPFFPSKECNWPLIYS